MSLKAMVWAFEQDVKPTQKLVLLALADHCDEQGRCWPSIPRLAARASLSDRAVRSNLAELASAGMLRIVERTDESGRRLSNGYQLVSAESAKAPAADAGTGVHLLQGDPAGDAGPLEDTPKKKIPPKNQEERTTQKNQREGACSLDEFDPPFESKRFLEALGDWFAHRSEKRQPIKPRSTTWKLQRASLVEMGEERSVAALKHSAAGGYQGIFEPPPAKKFGVHAAPVSRPRPVQFDERGNPVSV